MSQRVVMFAGISGVGKTTFLRRLAARLDFQHVTGGSLISAARDAAPDARDTIRHADLDENQRLLIQGFTISRDRNAKLVIMDGHVVIDDGEGLSKISTNVFRALGITTMVHLEADSERIAANRSTDQSRARPTHGPEVLLQHQELSLAHAKAVAEILGTPFHAIKHEDVGSLAKQLKNNV